MQKKGGAISCNIHDHVKKYKWAPFRLPLLRYSDENPTSLLQVSTCQSQMDSSTFYVLLLTHSKQDAYIIFINRISISEDDGLRVNQRVVGKFSPEKQAVINGFQGLQSVCFRDYIYLFYNLGSKSKNCVCAIDIGSLQQDENGPNDASPHVYEISSEIPNKAIPEGLILDYSLNLASQANKILMMGGLNQELKPLSSIVCFDTQIQQFTPYKAFNDEPRKRYGHTGVIVNDQELVIIGGSSDQTQNLTVDPQPVDKWNMSELAILNIEGQQWGRLETKGAGIPGYLVGSKAMSFERSKEPRPEGEAIKNWNISVLWHARGLKAQEYKVSTLNLESNRWVQLNIQGNKLSIPHGLSIPLMSKDFCIVFDLSPLELVTLESGKQWRQWTMWVLRSIEPVAVMQPSFAKLTTLTSKFHKEMVSKESEQAVQDDDCPNSDEDTDDNLTFEELLAIEKKKIQEEELKKQKQKEKKKRKKLAKQQKLLELKEKKN